RNPAARGVPGQLAWCIVKLDARVYWMVESLFWNSLLALVYRCSGAVVTFAFGISFARMMSIEEYGALVSLMTFGIVVATIGGVGQQLRVLLEIPSLAARKDY